MPEDADPESTAEAVVLPSEEWDRILATIATARNETDGDEELVARLNQAGSAIAGELSDANEEMGDADARGR
jgi:hypothetical protein